MLSAHMLEYMDNEEIGETINKRSQQTGFGIVPTRQSNHIRYYMIGFHDGSTRILDDINDHGDMICKPSITIYLNRMRERLRERERARER
jgi:hypothetical protein